MTQDSFFDKLTALIDPGFKSISTDIGAKWEERGTLTPGQAKWVSNNVRLNKGGRNLVMPDDLKEEITYWADLNFVEPHSKEVVKEELAQPELSDRREADLITILTAMNAHLERISDTLAAKLP